MQKYGMSFFLLVLVAACHGLPAGKDASDMVGADAVAVPVAPEAVVAAEQSAEKVNPQSTESAEESVGSAISGEVKPNINEEEHQKEKLFFPFLTFSGTVAKPPAPAPSVVVENPRPVFGNPPVVGVVANAAPVPNGQLIVIPQNTTISVVSPGNPITINQSGAPTIISQG